MVKRLYVRAWLIEKKNINHRKLYNLLPHQKICSTYNTTGYSKFSKVGQKVTFSMKLDFEQQEEEEEEEW